MGLGWVSNMGRPPVGEAQMAFAGPSGMYIYMFVVSGHLYRPLPLSQPCGLKVKIKDGFGTRPRRY